jgi:N-acetylglutamate synthase-like GNAT family acetyltransferase
MYAEMFARRQAAPRGPDGEIARQDAHRRDLAAQPGAKCVLAICVTFGPHKRAVPAALSARDVQLGREPRGGRRLDIRRAAREEIDEATALLEASDLPPLPAGIPLSNVLVGLEGGSVIGVIALEVVARRGLVLWAAVSEEHRAKGLGTSLGLSLIARAQELGLREIYAVPGEASDFFEGLGFFPVSRGAVPDEVGFKRVLPDELDDSAEIMRLELETRI